MLLKDFFVQDTLIFKGDETNILTLLFLSIDIFCIAEC